MNESTDPQLGFAAAARLARGQRIHALRMRVVATAIALFLAAWAGLFVQLVSGHDPALASSGSAVVTQSADPSVTDDGWSDDDSDAVLAQSASGSSSTAAVTTAQS